jgi:hypothetical protein
MGTSQAKKGINQDEPAYAGSGLKPKSKHFGSIYQPDTHSGGQD